MSFKVTTEITDDMVSNLLCNAFEGGSNYWYRIKDYQYGKGYSAKDFKDGGRCQGDDYFHPAELIPLFPGCAVIVGDKEDDEPPVPLNREAIKRGIQVMKDKYPRCFADWINGNDDASTGDVFLQCCIYGKLVFA